MVLYTKKILVSKTVKVSFSSEKPNENIRNLEVIFCLKSELANLTISVLS